MVIGITDPMRDEATYERYVDFVKRWLPGAEIQILSCVTGTFAEIERCRAVVFSGGGDVHPKFYGAEDQAAMAKEVSIGRDLFEFDLIREVMERRLPALAICRGIQVFNVAMGGTLLPDIEAAGFGSHRRGDVPERLHRISVVKGSMLHAAVGATDGTVNTSHHQAVDKPGRGLMVSARAEDEIIEALEWTEPEGKPFLLLVQWHPERLTDARNPFAGKFMKKFAAAIAGTGN
jgi:putative glutamine amidotransferase